MAQQMNPKRDQAMKRQDWDERDRIRASGGLKPMPDPHAEHELRPQEHEHKKGDNAHGCCRH